MFKLPLRTWVRNATAVFSGRHGAVTQQAEQAGCSRETVYEHARAVERKLAAADDDRRNVLTLEAENDTLRRQRDQTLQAVPYTLVGNRPEQRRFAVTAFALGVTLRQIETLLQMLLPPDEAPDPSTIGRWVEADGKLAGGVLNVLDAACVPRVKTLALDEIFFGGGRAWLGSSLRA